jgi:serine/threonine-protein kinase
VYRVEHPRLHGRDAKRWFPRTSLLTPSVETCVQRGADLALPLWHPHIVGVHDRGEAEGERWISMDSFDGHDASRALAEHYPVGMPDSEVAVIVTAVANALDCARELGLQRVC